MGFLIHKIWQILKRFSRAESWAQTSYFWRVYLLLPDNSPTQLLLGCRLTWIHNRSKVDRFRANHLFEKIPSSSNVHSVQFPQTLGMHPLQLWKHLFSMNCNVLLMIYQFHIVTPYYVPPFSLANPYLVMSVTFSSFIDHIPICGRRFIKLIRRGIIPLPPTKCFWQLRMKRSSFWYGMAQ